MSNFHSCPCSTQALRTKLVGSRLADQQATASHCQDVLECYGIIQMRHPSCPCAKNSTFDFLATLYRTLKRCTRQAHHTHEFSKREQRAFEAEGPTTFLSISKPGKLSNFYNESSNSCSTRLHNSLESIDHTDGLYGSSKESKLLLLLISFCRFALSRRKKFLLYAHSSSAPMGAR